jgi:hypothetical protein
MKFEWEEIARADESGAYSYTYRAKVLGGWLVKERAGARASISVSVSLVFIPDKDHKWRV